MNNFAPFRENKCGILSTKKFSGSIVIKSEFIQECKKTNNSNIIKLSEEKRGNTS